MEQEIIEHKERLLILEKTMGTTYYETGHLHLAISDAMKEYAIQYHKSKNEPTTEADTSEKALRIGCVSHRLSQVDQDELQKCKDSPVYFYNKYVRKEGQKELTEAEYDGFVKQVEYQRNMPFKLRSHYKDRPLTPDQCYEKLPDFLKNGG